MAEKVLSKEREEQLNKEIQEFEAQFQSKLKEQESAREEYYKAKAERKGVSVEQVREEKRKHADVVTVYQAKTAANTFKAKKTVSESFIHRTIRLIKGLRGARKKIDSYDAPLSYEKKQKIKKKVYEDAWAPVTTFLADLVEDFWGFLVTIWDDFVEIILFFVNIFITIGFYIGSFLFYIWDIVWDIRIALEAKKREVFQYFAATISVIAIILIAISSLSAYEYSYYGRKLGLTRNKQEVYQTIDALGDKLSEASGANVNIDVERDIKFTRVFGFNLDVDSEEDILNTLTYMKDIQVRAWAINIAGERAVILENEEVATNVLQRIRNDYAPETEGVVYTSVSYDQAIETEEVGVLLGEVWNPTDAVRYLKTGSTKQVEEENYQPLITMHTVETATYETDIKFGAKYIDNSELYLGETDLISAGVYGKNEVVAEVTRINGKEVKRVIQSTKKTKNPVDAVYYSGTKPIPEKKGTGTFIWPIKNATKSMLTSRFGSRNTGIIGASTYHEGMDIGVSTGTKIYACDGGVVTFAGWRAGYGYVVIIDHGGLFETRYGHCSKILVKEGEKVFQGQNIALVGNTGVSSGPHCHLEIRYNGTAKNPLDYLPAIN